MKGITLKRLESIALREVALFFQNDSKEENFKKITITEVRITNDLSYMTIFYSSYDDKALNSIKESLDSYKPYIRSHLARKINARKMPDLVFKYDEALQYGNKIESIIAEINKKKI